MADLQETKAAQTPGMTSGLASCWAREMPVVDKEGRKRKANSYFGCTKWVGHRACVSVTVQRGLLVHIIVSSNQYQCVYARLYLWRMQYVYPVPDVQYHLLKEE